MSKHICVHQLSIEFVHELYLIKMFFLKSRGKNNKKSKVFQKNCIEKNGGEKITKKINISRIEG